MRASMSVSVCERAYGITSHRVTLWSPSSSPLLEAAQPGQNAHSQSVRRDRTDKYRRSERWGRGPTQRRPRKTNGPFYQSGNVN